MPAAGGPHEPPATQVPAAQPAIPEAGQGPTILRGRHVAWARLVPAPVKAMGTHPPQGPVRPQPAQPQPAQPQPAQPQPAVPAQTPPPPAPTQPQAGQIPAPTVPIPRATDPAPTTAIPVAGPPPAARTAATPEPRLATPSAIGRLIALIVTASLAWAMAVAFLVWVVTLLLS